MEISSSLAATASHPLSIERAKTRRPESRIQRHVSELWLAAGAGRGCVLLRRVLALLRGGGAEGGAGAGGGGGGCRGGVEVVVVHGGLSGGVPAEAAMRRAGRASAHAPGPVSCELSNSVSRRVQGQKSRGGGWQKRAARGGEVASGGVSAEVVEGRGVEEAAAPSAGWPCVMVGARELVLAGRAVPAAAAAGALPPARLLRPRRQGKLGAAVQLPPAVI